MKNYGEIATPLISLLENNSFGWNDLATKAFVALTMCTNLVLTMPNFNKNYSLKCDASRRILGVVLMQEGSPLEFNNKNLCDHNLGNSTYEQEMMDILHAMETWRTYLIGMHF